MSKQFKKINFNASFGADGDPKAETGAGVKQPPEKVKKQTPSSAKAKSPSYNFKKFNFDRSTGE